jgi:hypothetical protein
MDEIVLNENRDNLEMARAATYQTRWNGSRPYDVEITKNHLTAHKEGLKVLDIDFIHVFIGKSDANKKFDAFYYAFYYDSEYAGNSILILIEITDKYKYVFIGREIYSFETTSEIIEFESPMGNSDVPYPWAVDKNDNIYLLYEYISFPNYSIKRKFNIYQLYFQGKIPKYILIMLKYAKKYIDPYSYYYNNKCKIYNYIDGVKYYDPIYIGNNWYCFNYTVDKDKFNRIKDNPDDQIRYCDEVLDDEKINEIMREHAEREKITNMNII